MFLKLIYPRVLRKNFDLNAAIKDISSFSALEGDAGDRILDHLCAKFRPFDSKRSRTEHEAGWDDGARAVIVYLATQREKYLDTQRKLEKVKHGRSE